MKIRLFSLSLILLSNSIFICAAPVNTETARIIAESQIRFSCKQNLFRLGEIYPVKSEGINVFYAAELFPHGYIIVSADDFLPPVIAYSFSNNIDVEGRLFEILEKDVANRFAAIKLLPDETLGNRISLWKKYLEEKGGEETRFQQWPPEGTTTTGGWVETNWTQSYPYDQMCPMDPVSGSRSYVGCPATTMAQILNYHKTTNNTQFDNSDDYFHNYAGRTYWIDDDYAENGFPSFDSLNAYLNTISLKYSNDYALNNDEKSALSFACGIAANQVYTSSGSGTFSVSQAYDAYLRFGCSTIDLLYESDTSLYSRLSQNMKDSLPAHLALVDEAWSTGHNIVVDGYNSDNYFHVNFGWGGSSNGWYLLPEEMPYSLTVIEGLIIDIMIDNSLSSQTAFGSETGILYPNPATGLVILKTCNPESVIEFYAIDGKKALSKKVIGTESQIDISNLGQGLYFVRILGKSSFSDILLVLPGE